MTRACITMLLAVVAVGCGAASPPSPPVVAAPAARAAIAAPSVPLSEPAEYDIARISRAAGAKIFEQTGVGDPYRTGVPYPVFLALLRGFPRVFGGSTDELAAKFGFLARPADPASADPDVRAGLPIGMHLTVDPATGVAFVVTNCVLCHAERAGGGDQVVIGLANKRVRIHAYDRAFADVTRDPSFTVDHLARLSAAAADAQHLTWPRAYADPFVAAVVAALAQRALDRAELFARTAADPPGRMATVESFAVLIHQVTGRAITPARDVGWVKIPDIVGSGLRTTLSWDGAGEGPMDLLAVEAEIEAGVRVAWLERHPFQGASLSAYLAQPAPRPAFPGALDRARAERGHRAFDEHCAGCHGLYGADGRAHAYDDVPAALADLGTDPSRVLAPTASFETAANDPVLTHGYTRFRRSIGYVPPILTNVWARAPYGHAGQWASLAVIATPPAARTARVVYAYGAPYDLAAVGIATHAADQPLAIGDYVEDGSAPGFSVLGHPFLADLGRADAGDVVEYLKTL